VQGDDQRYRIFDFLAILLDKNTYPFDEVSVLGIHHTLPNEKRIPELFGDIQTTQFQWISDTKWLSVQSGDC